MMGFGSTGGASSPLRFSQTRGRVQGGSATGVNYPSPFFDIAHTYLPTTVKQMFRWCRYYFLTNPLINVVVYKLSEYPVTDIIIDHENKEVVSKWTDYFQDHLRFRAFQVEVGLDYHVYGNAFVSIGYPFKKYLKCSSCSFSAPADKIRANWVFTNYTFRLTCPKCFTIGDAHAEDIYFRNASGIKLIRWNPEDIEISYNDITGEYTYFYTIPSTVRNDIVIGKKDVLEGIPQVFIAALRQQKGIVFSKDNLFHMRRPTIATHDRGWGIPLLLSVLKDVFYLQIMKKAQECVSPDTLLETPSGLQPAVSLNVGDYVRSHTGAFRKITERRTRPIVEARGDFALKISVSGLRQLPSTFSNNHPLYVLRRNDVKRRKDTKEHRCSSYVLRNPDLYEFKFVEAQDVHVGDYVGYPTFRSKECQTVDVGTYTSSTCTVTDSHVYSGVSQETALAFEALERGEYVRHNSAGRVAKRAFYNDREHKRIDRTLDLDEDLAYIAGWYVGDGSIGARRVDFSMGPEDDSSELESAIHNVFGVTCTRQLSDASRGWVLVASDVLFSQFMSGWIPGVAKTKKIPREILEAPDSVLLAFLRGYLEADGYRRSDGQKITVCLSNKQLSYQLFQLILSLGCIATVDETESYETVITNRLGRTQTLSAGRAVFSVNVSSASAKRLNALLDGDDSVPEIKSGKSGFFVHGYFALRVNSVERVECPEVHSFEVEEDHTFCVPGMATHNSILLEHIVPLRVLFPQSASGSSDPFTTINLVDWKEHVAAEIARWRYDNNYIPILPLPIGNQTIGGDGKALLMTAEIQQWSEQILNGMTVPLEFIKGGLSYAGTNVSMRMLENQFIGFILRHKSMARWIMREVAHFLRWPEAKTRFKAFKMADDIQRKAFDLNLNQAGKLSDTTLLASSDYNQDDENMIMEKETAARLKATKAQQIAMAEIQGEQQLIMAKYQIKSQQAQNEAMGAPVAPGEPGGPEAMGHGTPGGQGVGGAETEQPQDPMQAMQSPLHQGQKMQPGQAGAVDLPTMAIMHAKAIAGMPPDQQQQAIENLAAQSPELADLVVQMLKQMGITVQRGQAAQPDLGAAGAAASQVNMQPMPEQRPPRREAALV